MPNITEYKNRIKIRNERTKCLTQFMNGLGNSCISGGVISVAVGVMSTYYGQILSLNVNPASARPEQWQLDEVRWLAIGVALAFTALGIGLHLLAMRALTKLEPE